ncbi:MAG TPA: VanW family protein [Capsulimonadaceae bacterium]|nr:VanW family protein [Capsulimonadaceae bacterium]
MFAKASTQVSVCLTALCAIAAALLAGCGASGVSSPTTPTVPHIAANVRIDSVEVGGMTEDQAKQRIAYFARLRSQKAEYVLRDPSTHRKFHYRLAELGGYYDTKDALAAAMKAGAGTVVPLAMKLDAKKVRLHLDRIADLSNADPIEPKAHFQSNGGYSVSAGHAGRSLDEDKAQQMVVADVPDRETRPIDLPFVSEPPKLSPDEVGTLNDVLVSFTTTFHASQAERTNNLTLAAHNINGTIIPPGGVFSYNDSVGPRTHETGFKDAIIYVKNRMKKDVGGGICQVSSTLYNCVLLANLGIVERHCHSLPVHYVDAGRDATVSWGSDDFKFRNTASKPIIVRTSIDGGTLTEMLIGDKSSLPHPDAKVAISVSPRRTYGDGYAVTAFRIVKEQGVQIAREDLGTSFYHFPVGPVPH